MNKKKSPTDSTLRNVQAANKRFAKIEKELRKLKLTIAVQGIELTKQKRLIDSLIQGK